MKITEQTNNDKARLQLALEKKCIDSRIQNPKLGVFEGKDVIFGTNSKGETIVLYADLTAKNTNTNISAPWKCDALSDITTSPTGTATRNVNINPETCKEILKNYLVGALQYKARVENEPRANYRGQKNDITRCHGSGAFDNLDGIRQDELSAQVRSDLQPFGLFKKGRTLSWKNIRSILSGRSKGYVDPIHYIGTLKESTNDNMSKLIKESLTSLSEQKNKLLVEENRIISTRINYLFENNFPKNRKEEEIFADKLINEMVILNSQGLNETLISENILQSIAGFFGNRAGNIIEVIKERFAGWFLKKLGLSEDSILFNLIKITVGNIDIKDLGKLTSCDYWVDVLGKSIPETLKAYLLKKAGFDNAITDVIRNAFADYFDETSFGTSLKSGLRSFVCPKLREAESKVGDLGKDLKSKIVST
jgi:hypothetical protein